MRLTIPSARRMKLKEIRIVGTINVVTDSVKKIEGLYKNRWSELGGSYSNWSNWDHLPHFVKQKISLDPHPARFTFHVVSYMPTSLNPSHGMDRRHALKVLTNLGLEAPTLAQTVVLSSEAIRSNEIMDIIRSNFFRRVTCVVPFNPESPSYYYFGVGMDGKGSFRHFDYARVPGKDNLYFWDHDHTHDQGDENYPNPEHFAYHFPLLLGVRPCT